MSLLNKLPIPSSKAVRFAFLGVNVALALAQLLSGFSAWGLVRVAIVIGIVLYVMLRAKDDKRPVASYLCLFFVAQFAVYLMVHFDAIAACYVEQNIRYYSTNLFKRVDAVVLTAGIVLAAFGLISKQRLWCFPLGGGLVAIALVAPMWSMGYLLEFNFVDGGRAVVYGAAAAALFWTASVFVVCKAWPQMRKACIVLSIVLSVAFVVVNICCYNYVTSIAGQLNTRLLESPNTVLSWWRVVLCCAFLILLGIIAGGEEGASQEGLVDKAYLFLCAVMVFGLRVIMSAYSVYGWALYLVLLAVSLWAYANACEGKQTLGFSVDVFYAVTAGLFLVFAMLLSWGLWANAFVTFVFLVYFYLRISTGYKKEAYRWVAVVTFLVAEAFARMAVWRYSVGGMVLFGVVYAMAVATIAIIGMKHPANKEVSRVYYGVVVACVALLCLASLRSPVHVDAKTNKNEVTLTTAVEGDGNRLKVSYVWKDSRFRLLGKEQGLSGSAQTIPIEGEMLTVTAVDSHGVKCTRDFYYSSWLHGLKSTVKADGANKKAQKPA